MSRPITGRFELQALPVGTVLTSSSGVGYVVIGHDTNKYPIAVRSITATNPSEWKIYSLPQTLELD